METLLDFHHSVLSSINNNFRRYLHERIQWNQRMIAIKGPRGAGKTTLLLQHLKYDLKPEEQEAALYVTADHTWFFQHGLLETAQLWHKLGGKYLVIDEVHKYPSWSRELKNIYDGLPQMKVVFSASSALDLYRGEADLSRRVVGYELAGLSFREYLQFIENKELPVLSFDDLLNSHRTQAANITKDFRPLASFHRYLENGYLPFVAEGTGTYSIKLQQVINATLETDLSYIKSYNAGTAVKIKKLLGVIAASVPFKPNIADLARKLDLSRDSVYEYIYLLEDARLLNTLKTEGTGVFVLQKPDKLFLENTNLAYALTSNPDKGSLRETFLLNQLVHAGFQVSLPPEGDFKVGDWVIEVGGKTKKSRQVVHLQQFVVAADDLEIGLGTKIPLWMFGLMY